MSKLKRKAIVGQQLEYHKGEMCPYAEKTGRSPVLCQEGFCCRCQIWVDFREGRNTEADARGAIKE